MSQSLFAELIELELDLNKYQFEPWKLIKQTETDAIVKKDTSNVVHYRLNPLLTAQLQTHTTCPVCVIERIENEEFGYELFTHADEYLFALTYICKENDRIDYFERFAYDDSWEHFLPKNAEPAIHRIEEQFHTLLKELPRHRLYAVTEQLKFQNV